MKHFRTELKVTASHHRIGLSNTVLTLGSCFSEAIGNRLRATKVRTIVNPYGVIYNPASIHQALGFSIFNESVADHTYVQHQELHLNYNFHSSLAALSREALRGQLTETIGATHYFLKDCDWLMLTYGTAWVYQRKDTGEIVANCHKLPQHMFLKTLMTTEEVVSSFRHVYGQLKVFNPNLRVILTLSPVRHVRDTLELNSVSKAVLRVALYEIAAQFDDVEYFPAFEIVMDDLRDYRFYKGDLLHPSAEAEEYIWEKFVERYFSTDLDAFYKQWMTVRSAMQHKPFQPATAAHQQFLADTLARLEQLHKVTDMSEEILLIRQQLIKK